MESQMTQSIDPALAIRALERIIAARHHLGRALKRVDAVDDMHRQIECNAFIITCDDAIFGDKGVFSRADLSVTNGGQA